MFIELMPLLGERTVMLTVARIDQNRIRVNVIPTRKREDENAALCAPLSFQRHTRGRTAKWRGISGCTSRKICGFIHTLEEAKAEIDPRGEDRT